jgi:putative membrane protein
MLMPTVIKHHHPFTILYRIYRNIRNLIIPIALFLFTEIKGDTGSQPYWVYVVATLASLFIGVWSLLSWSKDTYSIDEKSIHIKRGVLTVTERTIPLNKIISLNQEQRWLYRLIGIVNLEVYTADSNEDADAYMVISKKGVLEIERLLQMNSIQKVQNEEGTTYLRQVSYKEIFMMSISSNAFWIGVPLVGTLMQYLFKWLSPSHSDEDVSFGQLANSKAWQGVEFFKLFIMFAILIVICGFLAWLFSLVIIQFKYKGWQVERISNAITIRYGYLNKRVVKINTNKIQSIRLKEKLFSRLFGYTSLWIDCVGYEGEDRNRMLIPAIRKHELEKVIQQLLPEFELVHELDPLQKQGTLFVGLAGSCIFAFLIVITAFLWHLSVLFTLLIPVALYVYKQYGYRHSGWKLYKNQLIVSKQGLTKTTVYVLREATQSIQYDQNKFQEFLGIYKMHIDIDSPSRSKEYTLVGINQEDILWILYWYKNDKTN